MMGSAGVLCYVSTCAACRKMNLWRSDDGEPLACQKCAAPFVAVIDPPVPLLRKILWWLRHPIYVGAVDYGRAFGICVGPWTVYRRARA